VFHSGKARLFFDYMTFVSDVEPLLELPCTVDF
jgi:hypothetical protein